MVRYSERVIGLIGFLQDIDVVVQDLTGRNARAHLGKLWQESGKHFLVELQKGRLLDPLGEEYEVLGLVPCASDGVVKAAYRTMMQQYHPDHSGGDEEMAKRLNEAYGKICEDRGIS